MQRRMAAPGWSDPAAYNLDGTATSFTSVGSADDVREVRHPPTPPNRGMMQYLCSSESGEGRRPALAARLNSRRDFCIWYCRSKVESSC